MTGEEIQLRWRYVPTRKSLVFLLQVSQSVSFMFVVLPWVSGFISFSYDINWRFDCDQCLLLFRDGSKTRKCVKLCILRDINMTNMYSHVSHFSSCVSQNSLPLRHLRIRFFILLCIFHFLLTRVNVVLSFPCIDCWPIMCFILRKVQRKRRWERLRYDKRLQPSSRFVTRHSFKP
jgi:hypothetical protein